MPPATRWTRSLLLGLLASAAALLAAPAADAATPNLTVYGGSTPSGTPVPAGPWSGINHGSITGGSFGVSMPDFADPGWSQTATLPRPANLTFWSVTAIRNLAAPVSFNTSQPRLTTTWETRGWISGGYVGDFDSGPITADFSNDPTPPNQLTITVSCELHYINPPNNCSNGGSWIASRMIYVLRDGAAPTGTLVNSGGPLLDGSWQTGATSTLELNAADSGSGVYRAFFREGGTTHYVPFDSNGGRCVDINPNNSDDFEFAAGTTSLVPCRTSAQNYALVFDLTKLGDGVHTGDIGIQDASGRETIVAANRTIRVNAPDGSLPDPGTPCENGNHDESGTCIPRPPVNTSPPALTGTAAQGETLTTDTGAWNDIENVTWTYRWEACGVDGDDCEQLDTNPPGCEPNCTVTTGTTTTTLKLGYDVVGKRLRSVVTATTNGGTETARSALTAPVTPKVPASTSRPVLSGVVQAGEKLQTTTGTWTNLVGPTSTQHVERCDAAGNNCATIGVWPADGYELTGADVGKTVRSRVVMTNLGGGTATAYSLPSPIVYPADDDTNGRSESDGSGRVRTVEPIVLPPAPQPGWASRDESRSPMLPVPEPPADYDGVSLNGTNASESVTLTARRVGRSRLTIGQRPMLEGRLTSVDGRPIVGARIDIVSHLAMAGATATIDGAVSTDSNGAFRYTTSAGPSRIVTFGYRLRLSDRFYTAHRSVHVKIVPKVTLKVGPKKVANGRAIRMRGRVTGAPADARKLVELQVRKGKRWSTFATTRLSRGRFAHRYRFGRTRQPTTYRLRALVRADATWPLQTGRSTTRKVKVTR